MTRSSAELEFVIELVRRAGARALERFNARDFDQHDKPDGTIVTDADLEANTLLVDALHDRFPTDAILSEELPDESVRLDNPRCWIVDPIDGTNNFAAARPNWAVLVGLAVDGQPSLGVVHWPTSGVLIAAEPGHCVRHPANGLVDWSTTGPPPPLRLALGRNVEGLAAAAGLTADVSARKVDTGLLGCLALFDDGLQAFVADPTGASEWDIAAVDAVIRARGGTVTDFAGNPRRYNQPDPKVRGGLAAAIDPAAHARLMAFIRAATS